MSGRQSPPCLLVEAGFRHLDRHVDHSVGQRARAKGGGACADRGERGRPRG